MKSRGTVALEAVIASGLTLVLLLVLTNQLMVFWQTWQRNTEDSRRRQWAAAAFDYLDRDMRDAVKVKLSRTELRIYLPEEDYVYRVTADKSFYRGTGSRFFPLAIVQSVQWWREEELVWVEITFDSESYRCCYHVPEGGP